MQHDALARYDIARSYEWNYAHPPEPLEIPVASIRGTWHFCGLPVMSPLGIAAGPLLNGRWVLYYASLGFDVLTYKTVRRQARECYELPNLVPVDDLPTSQGHFRASSEMRGSWAISFGMPSREPRVWQADVRTTRAGLPPRKLLSVSVVATPGEETSLDELADDYAHTAAIAAESGADCIEANFSCPNVATCDGQLYADARASASVAQRIRQAIGSRPLILKIGHVPTADEASRLIDLLGGTIDGLSMINTISGPVEDGADALLFGGQRRGVGGSAIREEAVRQVERFAAAAARSTGAPSIVGVGGARSAEDVKRFLSAGAHAVHLATAAMLDPAAALRIKEAW